MLTYLPISILYRSPHWIKILLSVVPHFEPSKEPRLWARKFDAINTLLLPILYFHSAISITFCVAGFLSYKPLAPQLQQKCIVSNDQPLLVICPSIER